MKKIFNKTFFAALFLIIVLIAPVVSNAADPIVRCSTPDDCTFKALGQMMVDVIKFLLKFGMTLSAIGFAWAGILYLTAGGDSGKISKAHEIFKKIVIGFIMAMLSYVIVDLIATALGLDDTIIQLYNKFIPRN
jgi:hypothetical protein